MKGRLGHFTLLLLVLGAVAGCATTRAASPPKAIAKVAEIQGTRTGTLEFGAGEQPFHLKGTSGVFEAWVTPARPR